MMCLPPYGKGLGVEHEELVNHNDVCSIHHLVGKRSRLNVALALHVDVEEVMHRLSSNEVRSQASGGELFH